MLVRLSDPNSEKDFSELMSSILIEFFSAIIFITWRCIVIFVSKLYCFVIFISKVVNWCRTLFDGWFEVYSKLP